MPSNKQITDKISQIVKRLCEERNVQWDSELHIPGNASYKACLAYAGYYYTNSDDYAALGGGSRRLHSVKGRCKRMKTALESYIPELNKSLVIDIGCGPGLFLHAAYVEGRHKDIVLYGYDHSEEMLKLAREIWRRRKYPSEPKFLPKYKEVIEAAKKDLHSRPKHLIFTFGYVLIQAARNQDKQSLNDFAKHLASGIDRLAEHAQTCTIVAIDAEDTTEYCTNKDDFTKALDQVREKSKLEWARKGLGIGSTAIWTVRNSNE